MRDIYQEVTDHIVAAIEAGTPPWLQPWQGKSGTALEPYNAATGRAYNGINTLILWARGQQYQTQGWLTYNQAQELGGQVRKGEHGQRVIFWKFERREEEGEKVKIIPFARAYTVFNVDQVEGLAAAKVPAAPEAGLTDMNALATRAGAIVRHGGNRAFYSPSDDFIQMPSAADFKDAVHYQATLAHELTHWTKHEKRLNRDFGRKRFGDEGYAMEELVAEIGSAFLCARHGIRLDALQHPAYVANWLTVLKNDKRAIFTAAGKARDAAAYLMQEPAQELALAA